MKSLKIFTYVIAALALVVPITPRMPSLGLDPSWTTVIANGFVNGATWGRDIIFTYGPLGFVQTQYYFQDFYSLTLPIWVFIVMVSALLSWRSFENTNRYLLGIAISCTIFVLPLMADSKLLLAASLPLIYVLFAKQLSTPLLLAGVIMLAVLSLIKATLLFYSLGILFLIQALIFNQKKLFYLLPSTYLLLYGLFLLLSGQELSAQDDYFKSTLQIVSGFSSAMSLEGSSSELAMYGFFTLLYAGLYGYLLVTSSLEIKSKIVLSCLVSAIFFIHFKQGFVRHDLHSLSAWGGFIGASLILITLYTPPYRRFGFLGIIFILVGTSITSHFVLASATKKTLFTSSSQIVNNSYSNKANDIFNLLLNYDEVNQKTQQRFIEANNKIAQSSPTKSLDGSVDTIDSIQGQLIAAGLDYQHRPIFQEYSAYTPALQQINQRYFEHNGPDYLLIRPSGIDHRLPMLAEGSSWPTFWHNYTVNNVLGDHLLLKKSDSSRQLHSSPLKQVNIQFNEEVKLTSSHWTFARLRFTTTWMGKLVGLIYKLPPINIIYDFNGVPQSYRLIPGMTEAGFYISPLTRSANNLLWQLSNPCIISSCPDSFKVVAAGQLANFLYGDIELELEEHRLNYRELVSQKLRDQTRTNANFASMAATSPYGAPRVMARSDKLMAHAPSRVSLRVDGTDKISVSYGIREGASHKMAGVCFTIKTSQGTSLVKDCVIKQDSKGAEIEKRFTGVTSGYTGDIIFENSCINDNCNFAWSYWRNLIITP